MKTHTGFSLLLLYGYYEILTSIHHYRFLLVNIISKMCLASICRMFLKIRKSKSRRCMKNIMWYMTPHGHCFNFFPEISMRNVQGLTPILWGKSHTQAKIAAVDYAKVAAKDCAIDVWTELGTYFQKCLALERMTYTSWCNCGRSP